jgi:hypothetical protein
MFDVPDHCEMEMAPPAKSAAFCKNTADDLRTASRGFT